MIHLSSSDDDQSQTEMQNHTFFFRQIKIHETAPFPSSSSPFIDVFVLQRMKPKQAHVINVRPKA